MLSAADHSLSANMSMIKKNKGKVNRNSGVIESINRPIVPDQTVTTLIYHTSMNLSSLAGFSEYLFNLNSVFDPDRTGVGHQPGGFDQWAAFYGKYRVWSCKSIVTFSNSSVIGQAVITAATNSATAFTNIDAPIEQGRYVKDAVIGFSTGAGTKTLTQDTYLPALNGKTDNEYRGNEGTSALISASPSEILVLHVVGGALSVGTAASFDLDVKLVYTVELFDRTQLAQS
jgi:hypothetical protein